LKNTVLCLRQLHSRFGQPMSVALLSLVASRIDVTRFLSLGRNSSLAHGTINAHVLVTLHMQTQSPSYSLIHPNLFSTTHREYLPALSFQNFRHHKHPRIPQPPIPLSTSPKWPSAKPSKNTTQPILTPPNSPAQRNLQHLHAPS